MVEWVEVADPSAYAQWRAIIDLGDAMTLIGTGALVFDFPDDDRHGLLMFNKTQEYFDQDHAPDTSDAVVAPHERYFSKVGGFPADVLARMVDEPDAYPNWGAPLTASGVHKLSLSESARQYFKGWLEESDG